jgi:hypothetical protein
MVVIDNNEKLCKIATADNYESFDCYSYVWSI